MGSKKTKKTYYQRLVKFLLGKQVSVETWDDREMAVMDSRGGIPGQVSSVKSDRDNKQNVNINFKNTSQHLGHAKKYEAHWNLQALVKSVQQGDIVCLLQGASKPTIIRLYRDHLKGIEELKVITDLLKQKEHAT